MNSNSAQFDSPRGGYIMFVAVFVGRLWERGNDQASRLGM